MNLSALQGNAAPSLPAANLNPQRTAPAREPVQDAVTANAVQAPAKAEPASRDDLEQAVKEVNDFVKPINNSLSFKLDQDTGQTVIKVIDATSQEVIRQIPSEEMLAIAKALDTMKGLLVRQKA